MISPATEYNEWWKRTGWKKKYKIPDCPECGNNTVSCEKSFTDTFPWETFALPYEIWKCSRCKKEYKVRFVPRTVKL